MSVYTTCRNSTYKSLPVQTYKLRNTCGFLVGGDVETGVLYCVSLYGNRVLTGVCTVSPYMVSIASFDTGVLYLREHC